jgi:hypothetical protein
MAVDYVRRTARAHYAAQKAVVAQTLEQVDDLWTRMSVDDIAGSWEKIRPAVVQVASAGQARAASGAPLLIDRVLAADGLDSDPLDVVSPLAFAGWTADGLNLGTAVDSTPISARVGLARGATPARALESAHKRLDRLVGSEVHDAGKGAVEAAMRLEPQIVGWERYVNTPCCSRCAILAGRFYKVSDGFERHPGCRCCHRPMTQAGKDAGPEQDPRDLFYEMTDEQQNAAFTPEGARAIRDGADISQVVNSRWQGGVRGKSAGMSRPGDPYTTAGTGRRSAYGRQERAAGRRVPRRRLSPQGVALQAGDDTVLYRRLLRENGYL